MWILTAALLIATSPVPLERELRGTQDPLKLPPRSTPVEQADPRTQDDAFRKAVSRLRGRLRLSNEEELLRMGEIGRTFDDVPRRCLEVLPGMPPDEAYGALRLLQRYGGGEGRAKQVEDLEFLLLSQKFGSSTSTAVETLAMLAGDGAPDVLMRCLTVDRSTVRREALEALRSRVRPAQIDRLLDLSESDDGALQRACLQLLGALPPDPRSTDRLLRALSQEPVTAFTAAEAFAAQGRGVVPELQAILRRPARGRSFGYAAFALAQIASRGSEGARPAEGVSTEAVFTEDMVEHLLFEIDTTDGFQRSVSALGLASLAFESEDMTGERYRDGRVLEILVNVVSPTQFVDHLAAIKPLAEHELVRLSGRPAPEEEAEWRQWWRTQVEPDQLCGARRRLPLAELNPELLRLHWHGLSSDVVVQGPKAVDKPLEGAFTYLLSGEQMLELVGQLEQLGFMSGELPISEYPNERRLSLDYGSASSSTPTRIEDRILGRLADKIFAVTESERWQLYRDPITEPDRAAFWRSESRWREAHSKEECAHRLLDRIVAALGRLEGTQRLVAIGHLTDIDGYQELLTEEQGLAMARIATTTEVWDDATIQLAQLALLAPGDSVWQELVSAAEARDLAGQGSEPALPRVFAILDLQQVRDVVRSGTPRARSSAILELAEAGDLEIVPVLLELVGDADENASIRESAIFALGELKVAQARKPLLDLVNDPESMGLSHNAYRTTLRSLGKIGGPRVVDALRDALVRGDDRDQFAAVQALGSMKNDLAVRELVRMMILRGDDTLGQLATDQVRFQGDLLATPALLPYLDHNSPAISQRVALILGEFQEPAAIDRLVKLLDDPDQSARVARMLSSTIGVNLVTAGRRFDTLLAWRRSHPANDQGLWLVEALDRAEIGHAINPATLRPGAGPGAIPELVRLAQLIDDPILLPLIGRVLRRMTGEDYGNLDPVVCTKERKDAILERYRLFYDAAQSAKRSAGR